MVFDIIASTGRTATTYIASVLNSVDGVLACHEGQSGSDKTDDILPLINLENAQCYAMPAMAAQVAAEKRGAALIAQVLQARAATRLIDVAYYNPTIAAAVLELHPQARMVGIVRDCEAFVRSATTMEGEDPLPVGWADPEKPLTDREKFIAMGRIRPGRTSPAKPHWKDWSAIERNIWLWQETNLLLASAQEAYPDRVVLCRFETLKADPAAFWACLGAGLDLALTPPGQTGSHQRAINKKPAGYQVGPASEWSAPQQKMLARAQHDMDHKIKYEC